MSQPLSILSSNIFQISSSNSSIKTTQSSQQSLDEQDKENIKPTVDFTQNQLNLQDKEPETNLFEIIFQPENQFKFKEYTGESLLRLVQLIETYNRFIGLYVQTSEIDINEFVDSLNDEYSDYYNNILRTLIQILLNELFADCLVLNVSLIDLNLIKDDLCLYELSVLLYKMINNSFENDFKEKSDLIFKPCDLSSSNLSAANKIELAALFIETILNDGQTYQSNIDLLNSEIENIQSRMNDLKSETSYYETRQFFISNPALNDTYYRQKSEYKQLEEKLLERFRALKNYSRLSQLGRVKFNKYSYLYFWRFKVFSASLVIERRFIDGTPSDWYQIDSVEMMYEVFNNLKQNITNANETLRQIEAAINDIKSNKQVQVNDFKFDNKLLEIIEPDEPIVKSILNSKDILTELETLVQYLVFRNFININLIFNKDRSLKRFKMGPFFDSIEWLNHPTDLESLKATVVDIFNEINKKHLSSKFATELIESWLCWCLKCNSASELRFAIYFLIKNIKWENSLSEKECQICFKRDEFKCMEYMQLVKYKCDRCHRTFHLKCVLESKKSNLFKSDKYHVLCTQCYEEVNLEMIEEFKKLEQKNEDKSKLNSIKVNSRALRLNARISRLANDEENDEFINRKASKRKRVFMLDDDEKEESTSEEEDDDDNDDEDTSRSSLFDRNTSERIRGSLRPRKKVNYNYDNDTNDDDL